MFEKIKKDLEDLKNEEKIKIFKNFFKTGKGEYGEGDDFLGISVPNQRKIAKKYFKETKFFDIEKLLESKFHEFRLTGLIILVEKYLSGDFEEKEKIFNFYIKNTKGINNWDLVDLSAYKIVGDFVYNFGKGKEYIYEFANSGELWKERISIISMYYFIKKGDFWDFFVICEKFLDHKHDLIHKASGWMLRELGKKNILEEEFFLNKYYKIMPRTMLRYAIEKFDKEKREKYLYGF